MAKAFFVLGKTKRGNQNKKNEDYSFHTKYIGLELLPVEAFSALISK
jgi:hypothetical protein